MYVCKSIVYVYTRLALGPKVHVCTYVHRLYVYVYIYIMCIYIYTYLFIDLFVPKLHLHWAVWSPRKGTCPDMRMYVCVWYLGVCVSVCLCVFMCICVFVGENVSGDGLCDWLCFAVLAVG